MQTDHVVAVIGRIHREVDSLIRTELERRGHPGLVPSHGAILARLYEQGPLPMGVLAESVGRKKNTVTVLVKKMEQAGYVRRAPYPEDSRVTLIGLTGKGEAFRKDFEEVSEVLLNRFWGNMDQVRKEDLVTGLERVLANLR